jgi:hypothetical protein
MNGAVSHLSGNASQGNLHHSHGFLKVWLPGNEFEASSGWPQNGRRSSKILIKPVLKNGYGSVGRQAKDPS